MAFCTSCGASLEEQDQFCGRCGAKRGAPGAAQAATAQAATAQAAAPTVGKYGRFGKRGLVLKLLIGTLIWAGIFAFIFSFDGCSSTEGSVEAKGKPLGDFVFTPAMCKSGEHESFYGVYLLGDNEDAGGIKVIVDPRDGPFVQFEVPGSCDAAGQCTVVDIHEDQCERFQVDIDKTSTTVNDIRLLDGSLGLKCAFPEGGSLEGDVTFESCD